MLFTVALESLYPFLLVRVIWEFVHYFFRLERTRQILDYFKTKNRFMIRSFACKWKRTPKGMYEYRWWIRCYNSSNCSNESSKPLIFLQRQLSTN
jgi:hypothetical protein